MTSWPRSRGCDEEIRHDIQALIDLGYIAHGAAESAMEDDWFRQVECDWRWPDGRYCNITVHVYALAASSPPVGRTDVEGSLAGYCSLEHANATPRPTLVAAQQLYEEVVEGAACVCGHCTADSFGAKAIHKLIDAYPHPIAPSTSSRSRTARPTCSRRSPSIRRDSSARRCLKRPTRWTASKSPLESALIRV